MQPPLWVAAAAVVAAAILVAVAVVGAGRRRRRAPFPIHRFPEDLIQPYEHRVEEIERMFVDRPREAVAAARLLVDDMLTRMGFPVRISGEERARDLRHVDREWSAAYRTASAVRPDASTEQLRRSLQACLTTARDLLDRHRDHYREQPAGDPPRPRIAG